MPGSQIPTKSSYLPNAGRPYRAGYTDGIHHGWDFYGDYGDEIVSLDDGVVIYTKKDFTWNDFESIKFDDPHSDRRAREHHHDHHHDENLDILRGNQIWIKTMTGDVVFYSHFDHINASLKAGDIVSRGEYLGTI